MPAQQGGLKYCPKCGKTLSVSEFGKNKTTTDGLQTYCKSCTNQAVKSSYCKSRGNNVLTKKCDKCGKVLPISDFSHNKKALDGFQKYCKSFMNSYYSGAKDEEKRMLIKEFLDRLEIFRTGKAGEINDTIRRIRKK
ncbi:hypothetical protein, partial [Intestinibacter sp.]|uniref:hypothetical protein n=1 Tax=Intestinibacter sp. TaxID=1965304 RepID=UPI002A74E866